jgi:hypothetical protein
VAEWLNAPVLKTGVPKGTESSNLSPSATTLRRVWLPTCQFDLPTILPTNKSTLLFPFGKLRIFDTNITAPQSADFSGLAVVNLPNAMSIDNAYLLSVSLLLQQYLIDHPNEASNITELLDTLSEDYLSN